MELDLINRAEKVTKGEVMNEWIRSEYRKLDNRVLDVDLDECPISQKEKILLDIWDSQPVQVFWTHEPIEWFSVELNRTEIESIRVITGPSGKGGWKNLSSPDGKASTLADKIVSGEISQSTNFVDVEYILEKNDEISFNPVALLKDPDKPPVLFDGNHRVVSELVNVKNGDKQYDGINIYLGVRYGVQKDSLTDFV